MKDEAEPKESSGGEEKSVEDIQETTTELKEEILDAGEASGISDKQKPRKLINDNLVYEVRWQTCQSAVNVYMVLTCALHIFLRKKRLSRQSVVLFLLRSKLLQYWDPGPQPADIFGGRQHDCNLFF